MRYETWVRKYRPIRNNARNDTAIDGFVYLPSGADWRFVSGQPNAHVWSFTVHDGPRDAVWLISPGIHRVNLMGFLVTEVPHPDTAPISVRY